MASSRDPEDGLVPVDAEKLEIVTYHNRDFQRFALDNRIYFAPVDEDETDRLVLQHTILSFVFDSRLVFPPLNNPRRILECGHGAGTWAIEVAEEFPACQVYGVDISPHMQPEELPENLHLQVDDLNRRFAFARNSFDLVHSQLVAGGIDADRWPTYIRDIFRVTRPGGWCQMVEMYYQVQSDNGSITDGMLRLEYVRSRTVTDVEEAHALRQWSSKMFESMQGIKDLRRPLHLANDMREHGFVDVDQRMIPMPTCAWSNDARDNKIGTSNRDNVQSFLSSLAIYPFTERLGMAVNDAHLLVAQARNEADNPALKAYFPMYVCIGRKPTPN